MSSEKVNLLAGIVFRRRPGGVRHRFAIPRNPWCLHLPWPTRLRRRNVTLMSHAPPLALSARERLWSLLGQTLEEQDRRDSGPDYSAGRAQIRGFIDGFTKNGGTIKEELWSVFRQTKDCAAAHQSQREWGGNYLRLVCGCRSRSSCETALGFRDARNDATSWRSGYMMRRFGRPWAKRTSSVRATSRPRHTGDRHSCQQGFRDGLACQAQRRSQCNGRPRL